MPVSGYVLEDKLCSEFEGDCISLLDDSGIKVYMGMVGSFIWIASVRYDTLCANQYLSWHTKKPRKHHKDMATHMLKYLKDTKDLPLVLGGPEAVELYGYADASHNTAPKGKSVIGEMYRLGPYAGGISARASTSFSVLLSSYEAELEGQFRGFKGNARIANIFEDLAMFFPIPRHLYCDNKAAVDFTHGYSVPKMSKCMELRLFYVREQYPKTDVQLDFMEGKSIPVDKITKLGTVEEHYIFTRNVMGHELLEH